MGRSIEHASPRRRAAISTIASLAATQAVVAVLAASASGQTTYTWTGGGGDDNWGTGANWGGTAPVPSTLNDLVFAGATRLTPNSNYTAFDDFRGIYFASGASSFNVTGNAIDLFGKIENNSSNLQTVLLASIGTGSASNSFIEVNPVSGNLAVNSSNVFLGNNQLRVWGNNGNTLTFGTGTVIAGTSGSVAINQNSNVVFQSNHTYTGATFINAGRLDLTSSVTSLGTSGLHLGDTSGSAAAELRLTASTGGFSSDRALTVRSGSSGTKTLTSNNTSGTNALTGNVAVGAAVSINQASGGTLNLSGVVSGTGAVSIDGGGKVRLSGSAANTLSGNISIASGSTLEIDKANVAAIANQRIAIVNGTVKWLQAGVAGNTAQFTVNAGGVVDLNGFNADFAFSGNEKITLSGGTVQTGAGTWTMTGNDASPAVVNGTTVSTISGKVELARPAGTRSISIADNATGVDLNFSASITDAAGGASVSALSFTTASGTPEVVLAGNNVYRGMTTIGTGTTVYADHANALGSNAAATTVNGTLALRGGISYASESINLAFSTTPSLRSVSGNNTWTGTITNPGGAPVAPVSIQVESDSLTMSGAWSGMSSARKLAKLGSGALIDSATVANTQPLFVRGGVYANSVSGRVNSKGVTTTLDGGTVASPDSITMALGTGSNQIRFGQSGGGFAAYGADMDANIGNAGATLTWGGGTVAETPAGITVSGGAVTSAGSIYFGGAGYTGSVALTFTGGGGSGAAGTANVVGGAITSFTLTNGGTGYTSAPTITYASTPGNGGTTNFLADNAPLILNSAVSSHKVTLKNALNLAASGSTFTGNREIRVLDNAASTADRAIVDSVISSSKAGIGIEKTGAGTLELAAGRTHTYTGTTVVTAGTLLVNGSLSTSTSAVSVSSGATIGGNGSINRPVGVAGGGKLAPGASAGTLAVVGAVTLADTSNLNYELNAASTTVGGGVNDLLTVNGDLTLDGVLNVTSLGGNNSTDFLSATSGTTWRLVNYSGGTFTDNSLSLGTMPTLGAGLSWSLVLNTGQIDLTIVAIPEPAVVAGAMLVVAGSLKRRRISI